VLTFWRSWVILEWVLEVIVGEAEGVVDDSGGVLLARSFF
jgi:hypothetical protein